MAALANCKHLNFLSTNEAGRRVTAHATLLPCLIFRFGLGLRFLFFFALFGLVFGFESGLLLALHVSIDGLINY